MLDTRPGSLTPDAPLEDLGPLAWVFEELRKSLDGATKAIKRFVRETEQSRHNDLPVLDLFCDMDREQVTVDDASIPHGHAPYFE
jgi:hypothetical protein